MPPKLNSKERRVSMAKSVKTQDGPAAVTLSKGNYKNVKNVATANPIKRTNMARTADIRKVRDSYAQRIADERAEQERDMWDLRKKISDYRRDNEKLLKHQKLKWGMTLDEMEVTKEHLQHARDNNNTLYKDLETKKADCDRLQAEMETLKTKISMTMLEMNDLTRGRRLHETDQFKLEESERRVGYLFKSNRAIRSTLLRNKVDPNVDAITMSRLPSPDTPLRIRSERVIRKVSNTPQLITSRNVLSFRSMDDVRDTQRTGKPNLKRTKSLSQKHVGPKFFLTQYTKFGNVVNV